MANGVTAKRGPKSRSQGEGSIYVKKAPGKPDRYIAEITLDIVDGKQVRRRRTLDTEKKAQKALAQLVADRDRGVVGSAATVKVFLQDYMTKHLPTRTHKGRKISNATLENYGYAAQHITDRIGSVRLDRLTPERVENHLLQPMADAGLSESTVKRVRSLLQMALQHALARGYVTRNAAELASLPQGLKAPSERKSLTVQQSQDLLEAAKGDRLGTAVLTQLMLGLRPGEVLGLKWSDLKDGVLRVQRSVKQESGQLTLGDVKTDASNRPLALPKLVADALEDHREKQAKERANTGKLGLWTEQDLMFSTSMGGIIDLHNYRRTVRRLIRDAGIPGNWTSHELRHTTISLLCDAGVLREQVADQVGHVDTRMIDRVYRHRLGTPVSAAVAPMEELFA